MSSLAQTLSLGGAKIPRFFYGTAWKEDRTADLTFQALKAGFTGIDTANQRKHYFEEAVGTGVKKFLETGKCKREDLFLQTKFTFARGQDHRKPYDENDNYAKQVADSFASSLTHLQTTYVDSYVLHGPHGPDGISLEDKQCWAAMEVLHAQRKVKFLGISNVSAGQLVELCDSAKVKPSFVQNRCYARMGWDKRVREICASEDIRYQGFSLLTANRAELDTPAILNIADAHGKTVPQVIFRFSQMLGMICLTGTSNLGHMNEDLNIYDFELNAAEMTRIENISI